MSTAFPPLPLPVRHEACARLVDLGLFGEARDLLDPREPADASLGVQVSLLAGDVGAARGFLAARGPGPGPGPGLGREDLLNGCIRLAAGDASALNPTERILAAGDFTVMDHAVFAVVAAAHDLHRAGVAALVASQGTSVALAVGAAAAAAEGDYGHALVLLESEPWDGLGEDPVQRTLTLLRAHGQEAAAQALVAVGAQVRQLPRERRRYWAGLGQQVVIRGRLLGVLQVLWVLCGVGLAIRFAGPVLIAWLVIAYCWNRWVPLPGLDLPTSQVIRGYRHQHWKATELAFADVVAFLGGAVVGLVGFAFIGRNGSDSVLTGFLIAGLAIGSIGGAVSRRLLSRRLASRREQRRRLEAARDLRCRCMILGHLVGPESRAYVEHHLLPESSGSIRRCPQTGSQFLDWPLVMATVRVHGIDDAVVDPGRRISPYL